MSTTEPHAGVVTCPTCEFHVSVAEPNEAVEVYRRHERVTGHEVEWERTALNVTALSSDVESVLETLDEEYSDGVPVGVLTAAASTRGVPISAVLDELYSLRMDGVIYEPLDDHFSLL
jgi:hypothetical protein